MPARPENGGCGGLERPREVFGDSEAKRLRPSDGDVRVAGEIEKELQAVAEGEAPDVGAAPVFDAIEAGDDAIAGKNALAQHFRKLHHEHAGGNAAKAAADGTPRDGFFGSKLRQHLRHAADRAGDGHGEEGHVEGKLDERRIEFLFAIEVEQVAHRLEGPERNAERQSEMRELL